MDEQQIGAALHQASVEVLEKMFFVDARSLPGEIRPPDGWGLVVEVAFDGALPGRLRLHLSDGAAAGIAVNFLGEDPSGVSPRQAMEVAAELANMICGSVLSSIESSAAFRLSTPRVLGAGEAGPPPPATCCALDTGHGSLMVSMATDSSPCPAIAKSAY